MDAPVTASSANSPRPASVSRPGSRSGSVDRSVGSNSRQGSQRPEHAERSQDECDAVLREFIDLIKSRAVPRPPPDQDIAGASDEVLKSGIRCALEAMTQAVDYIMENGPAENVYNTHRANARMLQIRHLTPPVFDPESGWTTRNALVSQFTNMFYDVRLLLRSDSMGWYVRHLDAVRWKDGHLQSPSSRATESPQASPSPMQLDDLEEDPTVPPDEKYNDWIVDYWFEIQQGKKPERIKTKFVARASAQDLAFITISGVNIIYQVVLAALEKYDRGTMRYDGAIVLQRKFSGWEGYCPAMTHEQRARHVEHLRATAGRQEMARMFQNVFDDIKAYLKKKSNEGEDGPEWEFDNPPFVGDIPDMGPLLP